MSLSDLSKYTSAQEEAISKLSPGLTPKQTSALPEVSSGIFFGERSFQKESVKRDESDLINGIEPPVNHLVATLQVQDVFSGISLAQYVSAIRLRPSLVLSPNARWKVLTQDPMVCVVNPYKRH